MFEDIEDAMKAGKKTVGGDNNKSGKKKYPRRTGNFDEDVSRLLKDELGVDVQHVPGGISISGASEKEAHKELYAKIEGIEKALEYIATEGKVKPVCLDAAGNSLVVGDVLKVPGNLTKTVLQVGWRYAVLSNTDDQTKGDGVWYENEINNANFFTKKNV